VTEYACAVWHSSVTAKQRDQLEVIQQRAVRIIFGNELDFQIMATIYDFHCSQIDEWDSCLLACTIRHTVCTDYC